MPTEPTQVLHFNSPACLPIKALKPIAAVIILAEQTSLSPAAFSGISGSTYANERHSAKWVADSDCEIVTVNQHELKQQTYF